MQKIRNIIKSTSAAGVVQKYSKKISSDQDAEICQQLCDLYFDQTFDSMFRQQTRRRRDVHWVMVAADWIFDERYNNYTATFTSPNQIYPTTEEELKHMNKEGLGKNSGIG